jgi:hypothetical protein
MRPRFNEPVRGDEAKGPRNSNSVLWDVLLQFRRYEIPRSGCPLVRHADKSTSPTEGGR